MNQQEMISSVAEDLNHISHGPDYDIQNELRVLYNARRRKDLAAGKSRKDTVEYCIQTIRAMYPGWEPQIDKAYFYSA